jgi:phosphatidylserine/phosphatidylglycerophosphate/cardiolipin synthase-like enzyme
MWSNMETTHSWSVHFSPNGGCTNAVLNALASASREVLVLAYDFTHEAIRDALISTQRRGVVVRLVADANVRKSPQASDWVLGSPYRRILFEDALVAGIDCWLDAHHAPYSMHNKVMVVDRKIVLTGSFNWTIAAELKNAENLLVIHDEALAASYAANWELHRNHSLRP